MGDWDNGFVSGTVVTFFFTLAICTAVIGPCCSSVSRTTVRKQAIERGFAEWVIVDEAGSTEFRWKERGKEE